ncbi:MAG: zf-HC2 domain-containing protein, partial [Gemmatimonadaceae bacterium]
MSRIDCEAARDDIDAFVIGALDADERTPFEEHVASCADCARLVEQARGGGDAVALTVPLVPASGALKARVLASAAVLGSEQRTPRPIGRRSRLLGLR